MRKAFIVITLLLHTVFLFAQEKLDLPMMQRIHQEATQHSQVASLAHQLTDVCGPRLTNSPGYRKAVAWTVQTFKQWGLQNAAPEPWGEFGKGWSNEHNYLALKAPYYQPMIAYAVPWTNSTTGRISKKLVLLDNLDSASIDKLGNAVKGNIIMLRPLNPLLRSSFAADARRYADAELDTLPEKYVFTPERFFSIKNQVNQQYQAKRYLESKGAVALLMGNAAGRDGTVFVQGALSYAKGYEPTLPSMVVSKEDYLRLYRFLSSGQNVEVEMEVGNQWTTDDLNGYNVVAEIPGTDPKLKDQVVMLGGHLDSWHSGTGATDNAAGCIAAMEAVRILKALGVKPHRTIRIVLWGGEEQWLLGSFGYVKKHFGDPKDMKLSPEQAKVSAYFNLDNGTGKIRGVYLQNNERVRDIFRTWLQPFDSLGAKGLPSSGTGGTDHLSFDAVGIPAFQFIQDPMEYETRTHHTNMDVYDHLYMDDLKQAATIIAAFVYNAAMRDEMLPRKPLPKPAPFLLENGAVK
jgi:hypothetical protein